MADSAGIDAVTGQPLSDWAHVEQSIRIILTTPIGSRVMRRDFGSRLPDLVDAKMITTGILAVYSAAAEAIHKWEPRFRMDRGSLAEAKPTGRIMLSIFGTYFPRGHLGDYSIAQDASTRVVYDRAG